MARRVVLVPARVKEKSVSRFECHPGGGKGRIDVLAADGLGRVCPLGSPDRGNVNQDAPGEKPVTGEAGQVWSLRIVDRPAVVPRPVLAEVIDGIQMGLVLAVRGDMSDVGGTRP